MVGMEALQLQNEYRPQEKQRKILRKCLRFLLLRKLQLLSLQRLRRDNNNMELSLQDFIAK